MNIKFTARRFRAHAELKEHAVEAVKKLDRFYDGIVGAEIILSYERGTNSVKAAEVNLKVHGAVLSATEKSEEYLKSIDLVVEKLGMQLSKYKTKIRAKDKVNLRALKENA